MGALPVERRRGLREDARRRRLRADRPAGRTPRARARDDGRRVRPVRGGRPLPRPRRRAGGDGGGAARRVRRRHAPFAAHRRDALPDRPRGDRAHAGRRPARERRARRARRRGGACGSHRVREARRCGARRLLERALRRAAARARRGHRHTAPRRLDRRGAGPRERHRRGADRRRSRRRHRHERRQHPGRRPGRPRGAPPVHPARRPARADLGEARVRAPPDDHRRGTRPAVTVRHATPHGRRAERRVPGARRPGRQLRERTGARRRARDRGGRGAQSRLPRLHEPRRGAHRRGRGGGEVSGTTIGPEPRLFLGGALGFGDRHRARAAHGLRPLRRPARRHRPRRHDVRRGAREHREHGGVADEGGRPGADGASPIDTPAPPELVEALRARGLRRRARSWSSDERRAAGPRGRSLSSASPPSCATQAPRHGSRSSRRRRRRPRRRRDAIGCTLGQIVKSLVLVCDGAPVVALVPGDRRADTGKVARPSGARRATVASARRSSTATGFRPGGSRPLPAPSACLRARRPHAPPRTAWSGPARAPIATSSACPRRARAPDARSRRGPRRSNHHNPGNRRERRRPDAGDREDLDERRARRLGGCDRPRRRPRPSLRHRRLRGHPRYETPRGPAVFRLAEHLQRLHDCARLLYMDIPSPSRSSGPRRTSSCARTASRPATSGRSSSSATARSACTRAGTRSRR